MRHGGQLSAWCNQKTGGALFQFTLPIRSAAGSTRSISGDPFRPVRVGVTGAMRSQVLPGVPTIGEFVPSYEASGWNGIVAPKATKQVGPESSSV
jgi:tripartite-type tricarboxylate transporter receptor subunit TctC